MRVVTPRSWRGRIAVAAVAVIVLAAAWIRLAPIDPALLDDRTTRSTVVVDRRGAILYEALSGDGTRTERLEADALPAALAAATIAAEDHRFALHPGVDPIALARAMVRNARAGRIVEGGSTISQQVAKLLMSRRAPDRRRGWTSKLAEAILALRLEQRYGKREILAMYLNLAAYGNQVVGAARASRQYFARSPDMLTPAQAAFIAGLPQRPTALNPYRAPGAALDRSRAVLRRMEEAGVLTQAQAEEARAERLVFTTISSAFLAPHFVEMVLEGQTGVRRGSDEGQTGVRPGSDQGQTGVRPGSDPVFRRSFSGQSATPTVPPQDRIHTTLDAELQRQIRGIIDAERDALTRHGAANVAVVVLDNASAEWLAWEGSGDYFSPRGGAINGPSTPRQPGSALKPFTYALAFEDGFTPASVLPDIPSHFPTADPGVLYAPRNYDGRYRGPLLARRALAGSENVPAVALASSLGVPRLIRFLLRAGLTTFEHTGAYYGLGVTLGNAEVRLDQLVAAYSAFARGGIYIEPTYIAGTRGPQRPLMSPRTAFWISDILSDARAREYTFGRGGNLEFAFPVAVKTGTSQAYHDNWVIGYSRHVTVGVWVGNFDRTPLRDSTGVTGAGPIFHSVMLAAEGRARGALAEPILTSVLPPPDGLQVRQICALSGMTANPWCPTSEHEWLESHAEQIACSWHHVGDGQLLTYLPPEYHAWHQRTAPSDARSHSRALPARGSSTTTLEPTDFTIVSPPDGATYSIDPTLRAEFQGLSLRATAAAPGPVTWRVDGRVLGTAAAGRAPLTWSLVPGRHTFVASDRAGREATATIEVR